MTSNLQILSQFYLFNENEIQCLYANIQQKHSVFYDVIDLFSVTFYLLETFLANLFSNHLFLEICKPFASCQLASSWQSMFLTGCKCSLARMKDCSSTKVADKSYSSRLIYKYPDGSTVLHFSEFLSVQNPYVIGFDQSFSITCTKLLKPLQIQFSDQVSNLFTNIVVFILQNCFPHHHAAFVLFFYPLI